MIFEVTLELNDIENIIKSQLDHPNIFIDVIEPKKPIKVKFKVRI